jgi:hypothetical protein
LQTVHDRVLDQKLTFCADEAWFCMSGYINAQSSRYIYIPSRHSSIWENENTETLKKPPLLVVNWN